MSLPSINLLYLTVSEIQPGQNFSRHPPIWTPWVKTKTPTFNDEVSKQDNSFNDQTMTLHDMTFHDMWGQNASYLYMWELQVIQASQETVEKYRLFFYI